MLVMILKILHGMTAACWCFSAFDLMLMWLRIQLGAHVQDNSFNLLFAAYDPSAAALCAVLRYLKLQPDALCQLRAEQAQV